MFGAAVKVGAMLAVVAGAAAATSPQLNDVVFLVVVIAGVVVYTVLQVRDYRPNKRLREDNADLRRLCDEQLARIDVNEKKIEALQQSRDELERTRDFDSAMAKVIGEINKARAETAVEHQSLMDAYLLHSKSEKETWGELQRELGGLTSAIQAWAATIAKE